MINLFLNIFYAWKSSYNLALTLKNLPSGFADNKAQTSLHIHADRSAPLLFTFWKVSYLNLQPVKFQLSS